MNRTKVHDSYRYQPLIIVATLLVGYFTITGFIEAKAHERSARAQYAQVMSERQ